jgi:hypothetical protein
MSLELTVKKPGNLLGVFLRTQITERQYNDIVLLLARPDEFAVTRKKGIGFEAPQERTSNAATGN